MQDNRVRPRPGSRRKQIEHVDRIGITMTPERWSWVRARAAAEGVSASMYLAYLVDSFRQSIDDHKQYQSLLRGLNEGSYRDVSIDDHK